MTCWSLCSGLIGAVSGSPTRHDYHLLSVPPSVQVHAPSQEAQAKNRRRGPRHDDYAMQTEGIDGAPFVGPAQRRKSKANSLFSKHRDNRVIVVAIRIAEDWQADADFSFKVFQRPLHLLAHLCARNLSHDRVRSGVRSEC